MPPVVVAASAAIGALALGATLAVAGIIGVATAAGVAALGNALKPDLPNGTVDPENDQAITTGGAQPRKVIYGESIVGGQIIGYAKREVGEDDYHVMVINIAGHPCESVDLYEIDGVPKQDLNDHVSREFFLGDQTVASMTAVTMIEGWTEDHIGYGQTYAVLRIKIDPDLFPSGINEIKFKVKGKRIYDPRKDSTKGGAGTHREDDQATWEWSENSQLVAIDYARFYGYKVQPTRRFDWGFVSLAANFCDEQITFNNRDGQEVTEKRYTCNGVLNNALRPGDGLRNIMTSMAAKHYRIGGKIYIKPAMYTGPATKTLYAKASAVASKYRPHRPEKERCNMVRARYVEPDKKYQLTDAAVVASQGYIATDRKELEHDIRLPFTYSETMAQRICHTSLERNRAGFIANHVEPGLHLDINPGMNIQFQDPQTGINGREFLVENVEFDTSRNQTKMTLIEDGPSVYPDNLDISQSDLTPNTTLSSSLDTLPSNVQFDNIYDGIYQERIFWSNPYFATKIVIHYIDPDTSVPVERVNQVIRANEFILQGYKAGDYTVTLRGQDRLGRRTAEITTAFVLDAQQTYTWRVYADDTAGTNISASDATKAYIGISFGNYTATPDTTDPTIYSWFPNTAAQWIFGQGAPNPGDGQIGWTYLDTDSGAIYTKTASGWGVPVGNIALGDTDKWLSGTGDPTPADGTVGDWWINLTTYQLFQKEPTGWASRGFLKGDAGSAFVPLTIHRRSATPIASVAGGSFNFDTGIFTPPAGWIQGVPAENGDPLYSANGFAYSLNSTGIDSSIPWSTPVLSQSAPINGSSVYVATLYRRSATRPSNPTGSSTYDFDANAITATPTNWSAEQPEGTDALWGVQVTFAKEGSGGTASTSTYSSVRKLLQDGSDGAPGFSIFTYNVFYRAASATDAPDTPSGGQYNFTTKEITAPAGWSKTPPEGDYALYASTTQARIQGTTGIDSNLDYSTPFVLATNGQRGAGIYSKKITGSSWSDSEANSATPGDNVNGDTVTLYNDGFAFIQSRTWNATLNNGAGGWDQANQIVIDANLIVNGAALIPQIFGKSITLTESLTVDSEDTLVRISAKTGEAGILASFQGTPYFEVTANSQLLNGNGLMPGTVKAESLHSSVIDLISNSIGASEPSGGGFFDDEFTFKYQQVSTRGSIVGIAHAGKPIEVRLTGQCAWTTTSAVNHTAVLTIQRSPNAANSWTDVGTVSQLVESTYESEPTPGFYNNRLSFEKTFTPDAISGNYDYRVVVSVVPSGYTKDVNCVLSVLEEASGGSAGSDGSQLLSSNNVWTGTNRFSGSETRVENTELILDNAPIFSRRTDLVAWNNQTVRDPRHIGDNRIVPHKYTMRNGTAAGIPYQERWFDGYVYHILEALSGRIQCYSAFTVLGYMRADDALSVSGQISSDGGGIIAYRSGTPWHSLEAGSDNAATLRSDAPYWRVYIGGTLGQPLIEAHMGGHVILKNSGSEKLRTVSDGVDVTGKINTDRLILSNKAAQIYTLSSNFTELKSDDAGIVAMRLRTSDDTIRGSVYANLYNQIGFINNTGTWAFQCGLTSHNNFIGGTLRQSILQGRTDVRQVLRIDNSVNTGNNKCVAELGGLNDAYFHFIMIDDAPQVKQFYFNRNVLVSGRVGAYQSGMYIHSTGVYDDHTRVFSPVNKPDWDDVTNKPPLMEVDNSGYHPGLKPEGVTTGWVRSTAAGIIPHASGGASSSLGTTTWAWNNVWGKYFYAKNSFGIEGVGNYINTIGVYDNNERVFSPNHLPTWTEVASKPPLMEIDLSGTYPIMLPNGVATGWIRTPQEGLLPYEYTLDGNATHRSDIGSVAWRFSYGYFETVDAQLVRAGQTGNYLNYSGVYDNDERVFSPNHLPNWDEVASKPELMHAVKIVGNSYYGLAPEGSDAGWIRTSSSGLIPYQADSVNGFSKVGTVSWPFDEVWGVDITAKHKLAINGSNNYINSNGFYGTLFHVDADNNWNATRLETNRLEANVHVKINGSNTLLNSNGVYGDRLQANTSNYINTSGHYGSLFKVNNSNNWDSTRLQATDVRASTRFHITASNEWTSSLLKATNINVSSRFEINSGNFWDTNGLEAVRVRDTSDVRKKCNFEPITNALEKVCILNGFTYNWKHDPEGERMAGVPAQDLQKVLPEAVCENKDGMLSVVAASEVALLIEAIKELNAKVDEQASEIAELKGRVA